MNELKQKLKELDDRVYEIINNASDKERAQQAKRYYQDGEGSPLSLIELGIAESIQNDNLEIFATLQKAYRYDCEVQQLGNLSLTDFCIFSGLYSQFFRVEQRAGAGSKHLYVILMSNGSVKIGIAYDIDRRYSQIKASSGMEIKRHWESELIKDAYKLETKLHKIYKDKRLKGEYFNVDYDEAIKLAQEVAMIGG